MSTFHATIEKLAFGGNGVCRINGKVCFVPFSSPGDEVRLAITSEKRSYCIAHIEELLTASPFRMTPPCPLFGVCGGCSWQHIEYREQLAAKRQILAETLWRGARVDSDLVQTTIPSPSHVGYRSRVQFKLHHSKDTGLAVGFYRTGSHRVVDAGAGCPILLPVLNDALSRFRSVLGACPDVRSIPKINIDCADDGVIAVVHYTGRDRSAVTKFLTSRRSDLLPVTGMYLQSDRMKPLMKVYGVDELTYSLSASGGPQCRMTYKAGGFAQVNRAQNQKMLDIVSHYAVFTGNEHVLDLYCGNGNLSLPLASQVVQITGIEEFAGSIASAKSNCLKNGIQNATFVCADAAGGTRLLAANGRAFDTVILDPPRTGAAESIPEICRLNPATIIYISCDPSTLARDCGLLAGQGYQVVSSVPIDMFPHTYHIESVTLLHKLYVRLL